MKKLCLVIFVVLVFVILSVFADYLVYKVEGYRYKKFQNGTYKQPGYLSFITIPYFPQTKQGIDKNLVNYRNTFGLNYNKPSVVVFGCSFAYGSGLEDNQTFSYKLSELTKRPVYTKASSAGGISQMLYLLQKPDFFQGVSNVEYVIYIFIPNHIQRLNMSLFPGVIFLNGCNPAYKLVNNELKLKKILPDFFYKSFLVKKIIYLMEYKKLNNVYKEINNNNSYLLMNKIFEESKNIIKQHYPNAKFIILHYDTIFDSCKNVDTYKLLKDLGERDKEFIIIRTKDIVGKNFDERYVIEDKYHPNEKAWEELVPALVKKLNF